MWRAFRQNRPVSSIFLQQVQRYPLKECVVEVESGRSMNFFEFNAHANKYANLFLVIFELSFPETLIIQKMGSKKDDVVALYLENGL